MAKNLVIVESPAKAKTIEGYLGKEFLVKSSFGHVRDLKKKELSVDVENGFTPTYTISADKKAVVAELKKLAKAAETVWLATDEDREGEAISWHLQEALSLKDEKIKRIVFHEITKSAILKAIENPRKINQNVVDAQQARRVLDRLVGFELSPVLWKKVKPSLSAGRVQSVAVRIIVERERKIIAFESTSSYRVVAHFLVDGKAKLKAELPKKFATKEEANKFLESCKSSDFTISNLETKPAKKSPAAPFTTSTLQQEASRKLGFSVTQTMTVAQKLYESGIITYMRTDSVNLSDLAMNSAESEIKSTYGDNYHKTRKYTTKSKGAQEAHEAIRPTEMGRHEYTDGDNGQRRLYELIWKRTIASQMADAQLERTTATIDVSKAQEKFIAKGEVLKFDGFLKVYLESTDDEGDQEQTGILPPLSVGEKLTPDEIAATQRFTHHPPRYTEASLVKKLEELGIGRPSTYAPTISTIQKRGYIVKESREGVKRNYEELKLKENTITEKTLSENTGAEKNKLFPTDIGGVVNDFLVEHFDKILEYSFTANVEQEFDEIAQGNILWPKMIDKFYHPFHKTVENTLEVSEKASGERELGTDPVTGKPVLARIGRFGPLVQLGESSEEEKPKFASLLKHQSITTITLEEALELFKLPRDIGEYEGKPVTAAIGRFGPYVKHGSVFISIPKDSGETPFSIQLEKAIELIEKKKVADKEKYIKVFSEDATIQVLNGRYGPYIKAGKKNVKIPKGTDPKTLTLEDCKKLAAEAPAKKKR